MQSNTVLAQSLGLPKTSRVSTTSQLLEGAERADVRGGGFGHHGPKGCPHAQQPPPAITCHEHGARTLPTSPTGAVRGGPGDPTGGHTGVGVLSAVTVTPSAMFSSVSTSGPNTGFAGRS